MKDGKPVPVIATIEVNFRLAVVWAAPTCEACTPQEIQMIANKATMLWPEPCIRQRHV